MNGTAKVLSCRSALRRPRARHVLAAILLLGTAPSSAWAVQAHGGAEGLVSHQIGHLLFTLGMAYLLYRLRLVRQRGAGWFEFKTFLWLLIFWNLQTFAGHWLNEQIPDERFIRQGAHVVSFTVTSILDAVYYLTRLDHLLLVPALLFLLLALRRWRAQP